MTRRYPPCSLLAAVFALSACTLGGDGDAPPGGASPPGACANDACRASFENADWRLRLAVLDDDLLHFEFSRAASPAPDGPIEPTEMIERRDYPGPQRLNRPTSASFETAEMGISVDPATLCLTVTDRLRDFELGAVCPHAPGDLRLERPGATHAYGLGQHFVPAPQFGDLVGKVRSPGVEFGNAMTGFGGGATGNTQIPLLLAMGADDDAWGLFVDVVEAQTWALRGEAWRINSRAETVAGYVMTGPDALDIRRDYLELTGRPPVPPRRLFGLWLSEYGYDDWAEAEDRLTTLTDARFPVDGFVLDLQWFGGIRDPSQMGSLTWDLENFPEPAATLARFDERFGVEAIHIEESYVDEGLDIHQELADRGFLVRACDGCEPVFLPSWWGSGGMIDWSNPEAGAWWHEQRRRPLLEDGLFGHWTDLGEPENYDETGWYFGGPTGSRNDQESVHNLYNFYWSQSIFEGYASEGRDRRAAILSRSGTAGSQRFGVILWSGDIGSNFDSLDAHFNAQTQVAISGVDYYGSDVGGFHRGGIAGAELDELYTQWLAASALLDVPVRPHVMNVSNAFETAPDRAGDRTSNLANLRLRYALTPYLYSLAHRAWDDGEPVFPPIMLRYGADEATRALWSHKLLGDDLLTVADSTPYGGPRRVYLPAGRWTNFHTGEWLASAGQWFDDQPTVVDGVTRLPLYARAGAILPLMHVDEETLNLDGRRRDGSVRDELVLKVFGGADGEFLLTEDDGLTLGYQRGERRRTLITQGASGGEVRVRLDAAEGSFGGAKTARAIVVRLSLPVGHVSGVTLNGERLPWHDSEDAARAAGSGWWSPASGQAGVLTPERAVTRPTELAFLTD